MKRLLSAAAFLFVSSAFAQSDDAVCQSYGARPGTDVYVQCRMQLQQQHTDAARGRPSTQSPTGYQIAPPPRLRPYEMPKTCRSVMISGVLQTTCN